MHRRDEQFAESISTAIWKEIPTKENPYVAERALCHGYDLFELARNRSFLDVLYLLLTGELPTVRERRLLEALGVALCNPGPRHPATRAAMAAAVSKTNVNHLLPIGISVLSGSHLGSAETEACMRFLKKNRWKDPERVARNLRLNEAAHTKGDRRIAPGFGTRFGSLDVIPNELAKQFDQDGLGGPTLEWGNHFASCLEPHGIGWLMTGLSASVFVDLDISPISGAGLFQLLSLPGILAHSAEFWGKPVTSMPFVSDENYHGKD